MTLKPFKVGVVAGDGETTTKDARTGACMIFILMRHQKLMLEIKFTTQVTRVFLHFHFSMRAVKTKEFEEEKLNREDEEKIGQWDGYIEGFSKLNERVHRNIDGN